MLLHIGLPSLNILGLFVFELCGEQTNRQTNKQTHSNDRFGVGNYYFKSADICAQLIMRTLGDYVCWFFYLKRFCFYRTQVTFFKHL